MVEWTPLRIIALIANILSASVGVWQIVLITLVWIRQNDKFNKQAGLRWTSYLFTTVTVLCHQMEAFYGYLLEPTLSDDKMEYLTLLATSYGTAYAVLSLVGVFFYIACLLNRYERLELIMQGSLKQKLFKLYRIFLLVQFIGTIILELVWRILNIRQFNKPNYMDLFFIIQICELVCYLSAIITEFYVNIRLIKISIQIDSHPSLDHSNRAVKKLSRAKLVFKTHMIRLFLLLVLMDIGMLLVTIVPQSLRLTDITTFNNIMSAWMVLHAFVSFKLLDLFLAKLSHLKRSQNQLRNERDTSTPLRNVAGNTFQATTTHAPTQFMTQEKSSNKSTAIKSVDMTEYQAVASLGLESNDDPTLGTYSGYPTVK